MIQLATSPIEMRQHKIFSKTTREILDESKMTPPQQAKLLGTDTSKVEEETELYINVFTGKRFTNEDN